MVRSLPFDDKPAIPRWKRVCLFIVAALAVAGMGVAWNALQYQRATPILCVVAILLYVITGALSLYPALYPREVEEKFVGFARNALWLSFVLLCFTTVLGGVGWLLSAHF